MQQPNKPIQYKHYNSGIWKIGQGSAIVEASVPLTVNGEPWLTFMCTPQHLEALAIGFLFNEGFIESADEIAQVRLCAHGDNVDVWLNHAVQKPTHWRKTTGCTGGVTAQENDDLTKSLQIESTPPKLINGSTLSPSKITSLVSQLFEMQDLYRQSGGIHSSALSDGEKIVVVAEDIGRHNTLDKIAGRCLLEKIHLDQRLLLTTGRISSEMLQKASRLSAAIVISRSAASAMAIQLAERWNITLVGYARRDEFKVFTAPYRISDLSGDEIATSLPNVSPRQS